MRTECSRNCWIAAGLAGLLVWLSVALLGSAGWLAGLALGLLTAWILGGILVWGVCQGAGSSADNEALLEGGWRDEPFTPTRRVVRAGGEVVSEEPLAAADRIPGGAPLDSRMLTPARDGGAPAPQQPVGARAGAAAGTAGPEAATGASDAAAGASDAAPAQAGSPEPASKADAGVPAPAAGEAEDAALIQPAPGAEAQVAHPSVSPVEGIEPQDPERPHSEGEALALRSTGFVEPRADAEAGADPRAPEGGIEPLPTGGRAGEGAGNDGDAGHGTGRKANHGRRSRPAAASGDPAAGDDLTRIRGIGPMLQTWLAAYGVTRYDQIAAWDDADITRFSNMMGRMGHRIRREDWVGQARLLAAGGETAHSHAVDTGEAG